MNSDDSKSLELTGLCDALIDGTIDDAGHEKLARWLLESDDARRFYAQYMGLSASLCHYASELQTEAPEPMPAHARIIRHPASWWTIGTLAASLVIFFTLAKHWSPNNDDGALDTDRFVAVLLQTKNCRWAPGSPAPNAGDHLNRGQVLAISGGLAEIAFDCGAIVVIEGPASLELDSAWAATLRRGTLRAQVPPEAVGFRVSNPAVEVVDLGTEFTVVANEDGAAEVLVLKGSVETASEGKPLVLREKEGRRFAKTGASDVRDRDRKLERLAQTLTLDTPPAPLAYAHWSFDESEGDIATASVVGMPAVRPIAHFEHPTQEAGSVGRWGRALCLDGTFAAAAPFPGIASDARRTVAFWVRLPQDAPLTSGQTILAWGEKGKGRKTGNPATLLGWNARPGQGTVGALRADRGPDAVVGTTPLRDGNWHHVAATFVPAGRTRKLLHVRLYVDGRLEATSVSKPKRPAPPSIVPATHEDSPSAETLWIGRPPGGRVRGERFRGEIDELIVAGRALTAQEIRRLMKTNSLSAPKEETGGDPNPKTTSL